VAALQPASVTIDGEAVVCDDIGVAVFEKLHSRAHDGEAFLYAFDLLELDGEDLRPRSLDAREAEWDDEKGDWIFAKRVDDA
jgi:bifunctional non-homologous end joining protein LigD